MLLLDGFSLILRKCRIGFLREVLVDLLLEIWGKGQIKIIIQKGQMVKVGRVEIAIFNNEIMLNKIIKVVAHCRIMDPYEFSESVQSERRVVQALE